MNSIFDIDFSDIFYSAIFLCFVLRLLINYRDFSNYHHLVIMISLHICFTIFYYYLATLQDFDANTYFREAFHATNFNDVLGLSTNFIISVCYFLIHFLNFGFFSVFLFFSYIGIVSFTKIFHYYSTKNLIHNKIVFLPVLFWLLLLPSVHFYSSMIGKDSIMFCCITYIVLYVIDNSTSSKPKILFCFVLGFLIRPHITLILLFSFVLFASPFSNTRFIFFKKFIYYSIVLALIPTILFLVTSVLGISDIDILMEYFEQRVEIAGGVGGNYSVDMKDMNFIGRLLTVLLRPSIFDIKNTFGFILALENIIWFFIFLKGFYFIVKNFSLIRQSKSYAYIKFSIFYVFFTLIALSFGVGDNLFLFVRQKLQIVTPFYFLYIILDQINLTRIYKSTNKS
jgi:hypothetical protein